MVPPFLAFMASDGNSSFIQIIVPINNVLFLSGCFEYFKFSLVFSSCVVICLDINFFGFILIRVHRAFLISTLISLPNLESFQPLLLQIFFQLSMLSPFSESLMLNFWGGGFLLFHRSLGLFSGFFFSPHYCTDSFLPINLHVHWPLPLSSPFSLGSIH